MYLISRRKLSADRRTGVCSAVAAGCDAAGQMPQMLNKIMLHCAKINKTNMFVSP
jgi:hypothetical protein